MKRHPKAFVLSVLLLVLLSAGVVSAAGKTPPPLIPESEVVTAQPPASRQEQLQTIAYWTRERSLAAQPLAMPVDSTAVLSAVQPNAVDPYGGRAILSPPAAPLPNAAELARADYPDDWAALESGLALEEALPVSGKNGVTGTSSIYTGYFLDATALQKMYPHPWVGRFVFSGGTCTATAIANNHVVTAAHCVYDTAANRWYSNMAFQPAYRAGSAPYGTFPSAGCVILTAWINLSGSYSLSWAKYDVAVCDMGKNSAGRTLVQMVGNAGRETNASYVRHLHQLGYPGRNYLNQPITAAGNYLHTCVGETRQYATEIRGVGCNMGPGISGGPWMTGYMLGRGTSGYVSGVSSGMDGRTPNSYGVRFSSANITPICNYTGC